MENYDPENYLGFCKCMLRKDVPISPKLRKVYSKGLSRARKEWTALKAAMTVHRKAPPENPIERRDLIMSILADKNCKPKRRKLLERYLPALRVKVREHQYEMRRGFVLVRAEDKEAA